MKAQTGDPDMHAHHHCNQYLNFKIALQELLIKFQYMNDADYQCSLSMNYSPVWLKTQTQWQIGKALFLLLLRDGLIWVRTAAVLSGGLIMHW